MFSGGIERNRWHEMNQSNYGSAGLVRKYFTLNSCNDANKEVLAISFLSNVLPYLVSLTIFYVVPHVHSLQVQLCLRIGIVL